MAASCISKMCTVTWITFQKSFAFTSPQESGFLGGSRSKTPLSSHFKSLIWKNFAFTKGKFRLLNRERVRITIQNGFGNAIHSFVNRPFIWSVSYHALILHVVERHHKGSRTTPHEDNSPPDKNEAQPLPTRTTIPRTIPHQDNSPLGSLPRNKTTHQDQNLYGGELSSWGVVRKRITSNQLQFNTTHK